MSRKIKLIKKQADTQQAGEGIRSFVARVVKPKREDYVLNTTAGQEEEEVTTLEMLKAAQDVRLIDRKAFRQGLQRLDANVGGAAGMTAEEKKYSGERFAFADPVETITEFPDVRDRINNGIFNFHAPAVEARDFRFQFASSIIYNTVDEAGADTVINRFITPQTAGSISLFEAFVKFGKEGSAFGDADHFIMDYVRSIGAFLNAGLREDIQNNMQAVTGNLTVDEVLDAIENALIEGIFVIP